MLENFDKFWNFWNFLPNCFLNFFTQFLFTAASSCKTKFYLFYMYCKFSKPWGQSSKTKRNQFARKKPTRILLKLSDFTKINSQKYPMKRQTLLQREFDFGNGLSNTYFNCVHVTGFLIFLNQNYFMSINNQTLSN